MNLSEAMTLAAECPRCHAVDGWFKMDRSLNGVTEHLLVCANCGVEFVRTPNSIL